MPQDSGQTYVVAQSLPQLHYRHYSVIMIRLLRQVPHFIVTVCVCAFCSWWVCLCRFPAAVAMQSESANCSPLVAVSSYCGVQVQCTQLVCSSNQCRCAQRTKRSELKPSDNKLLKRGTVWIAPRVATNLCPARARSKSPQCTLFGQTDRRVAEEGSSLKPQEQER